MADKIAHLRPKRTKGVVPICTETLNMARAGEIAAIAIVYLHVDGDVGYVTSGTDSFYKLVGALEHLKFEMLADKTAQGD
jgi:hypothetical protein